MQKKLLLKKKSNYSRKNRKRILFQEEMQQNETYILKECQDVKINV